VYIASARVYALLMLFATKIDVARTVRGRGFTVGRIGFKEVAPALLVQPYGKPRERQVHSRAFNMKDTSKHLFCAIGVAVGEVQLDL